MAILFILIILAGLLYLFEKKIENFCTTAFNNLLARHKQKSESPKTDTIVPNTEGIHQSISSWRDVRVQGYTNVQGYTGYQGFTGTGSTGYQGSTGMDYSGSTGYQGSVELGQVRGWRLSSESAYNPLDQDWKLPEPEPEPDPYLQRSFLAGIDHGTKP